MDAEDSRVLPLPPSAIEKCMENGAKVFGWRCIGDVPAMCVVELQFTVVPRTQLQSKQEFEQEMLAFAARLSASGYFVMDLGVHQRDGKRPWASFHCQTPQYRLRKPTKRHQIKVIE